MNEGKETILSDDNRAPVAFDAKAFRQALGFFPTGVAIMTTVDFEGRPVGLTCNSFSSVSLDPPLVLWSLRSQSRLMEVFRAARRFAINVLSEYQKDLSTRFASPAVIDKFEGVAFASGALGMPLIESAGARFECSLHAEHVVGDHLVLVGKVEHFDQAGSNSALVFHRGAYFALSRSLRDLALSGQVTDSMLRDAAVLVYGDLARLAAVNATAEDHAAMEDCLRKMEQQRVAGRIQERYETAQEFLRCLSSAAHNAVLSTVADSLTTIMGYALLSEMQRYKPDLVQARWDLFAALKNRQPALSADLIKEYFRIRFP